MVIGDNGQAHGGVAVCDDLTTPDIALHLVRLPAYNPDGNPDEAIWAWAREEVTANTCPGTTAKVQEKLTAFFAGQRGRTSPVRPRCRRTLQALATVAALSSPESHHAPPWGSYRRSA